MQRDERGSIELPLFSSVNNAQMKKYNRSSYRSISSSGGQRHLHANVESVTSLSPWERQRILYKGFGTIDWVALTTSIVA
jgi:hypothetical protein